MLRMLSFSPFASSLSLEYLENQSLIKVYYLIEQSNKINQEIKKRDGRHI